MRQSPGRARRGTISQLSHSSRKCPNSTTPQDILGWDTYNSVKLNNNRQEYLQKCLQARSGNTNLSPKGRTARLQRLTRSGVRQYMWSHREPHGPQRNPTHGETPLCKSNRTERTETASKEGRHCERDLQTRPTQRKGGRHAQDRTIERHQDPPQKRTRTPSKRSEGWNERLRQGLKLRNKREIGGGPRKGRTKERGKNSHRLEAAVRDTGSAPVATGSEENPQAEGEAQPKEIGSSTTHNRRTGSRAMQVVREPYLRPGNNKGETQEFPKTRCPSEDYQKIRQ